MEGREERSKGIEIRSRFFRHYQTDSTLQICVFSLIFFFLPLMAYFLDRVGDVPKRAGKRNRNDFDEASAVPALQDVIALQPRKRRRRKGDNPRQIFEVTDKHGGWEYPSSFNSTRALKQYQNGTDADCQCEKCGKTFNSKRALDQHQNATGHAGRETPAKMALSFPIRKTLPIETNWANIALTGVSSLLSFLSCSSEGLSVRAMSSSLVRYRLLNANMWKPFSQLFASATNSGAAPV